MTRSALTLLVLLDLSALVVHTALRGRITATSVTLAFSAWTIMRIVVGCRPNATPPHGEQPTKSLGIENA